MSQQQEQSWREVLNFGWGARIPVVLQTEVSECGLACLVMIAQHQGVDTDLLSLRTRYPQSLRGAKLQDIIEIAASLGITSRAVGVELEDLDQLQLPAILHWDMKHYVVLVSVRGDRIEIIDPAVGRTVTNRKEAGKHFTGVALEFDAKPAVRRVEKPKSVSLRALAGTITGLRSSISQVIALALLLEVLALLAPQFMQLAVDQVLAYRDLDMLTLLGVSFLAVMVLRVVVEAARSWVVIWVSANLSTGWTANVFGHLMRLPLDYFGRRFLGDVVSRFGAITAIQQTLTTKFVVVVIDGVMAALTGVVLLMYSVKIALTTFLFAAVYAVLRIAYFSKLQEANLKHINVFAIQQSSLIESLRAIQTLKLNNMTAHRAAAYMNATAKAQNASIAIQKLNLLFEAMNGSTSSVQRVVVLWFGAWLALNENMTAGMLMAMIAYSDQFTARFAGLADYAVQFKLLRLHGERLADIVLTPAELYAEPRQGGNLRGTSVRFDAVTFSYSSAGAPVLNGCSFSIGQGEIVAVTGESGKGKSTIAKLLVGALDQQAGTISIGGNDIRHIGKSEVRRHVACVMQDDQLLSGSILENISLFDQCADIERVAQAARQAQIASDIESMPMGYQTAIGDMGSALSGGQQQRLLIARALYRSTPILVLDEATSQLDLESEARICEEVRNMGVTVLLIAHRPQMVAMADRVLRLERGGIVESSPVKDKKLAEALSSQ